MSTIRCVSRFLSRIFFTGRLLTEDDLAVARELRRKGFAKGTKPGGIGDDSPVVSPKVVGIKDRITTFSGDVVRNLIVVSIVGSTRVPMNHEPS